MPFSIDPSDLIGSAISDLVKTSIIIGMPSPISSVPQFVLATIPTESAQGSVTLPSLQLTAGDYLMKVAVNSGTYSMTVILSDYDPFPSPWLAAVTTAVQQLAGIGSSLASFGAVLPNLSGLTSNFVQSQLGVLYSMRDNAMPITLLNSYIHLGAISQKNPNLQSNWYIETISVGHEEAEGGLVVDLGLKELLSKKNSDLSDVRNLLGNLAGIATAGLIGTNIL